MFSVIDRYILRSLLANYLIALGTMLSLYVVLDMFVNLDEFTEKGYSTTTVIQNVISYYRPNLFLYFAQLSGVIPLFAAMVTIARMRKLNEMTAILASGVSLYRVAAPIVIFGMVTTALLIVDTEWAIPSVAHQLARDHDDVGGQHTYQVLFLPDGDDKLLSAGSFHPLREDLQDLLVLVRDKDGAVMETIEADHATWQPPDEMNARGRWVLERGVKTTRSRAAAGGIGPRENKVVTQPTVYESELGPKAIQMRQSEGWIGFLSLRELSDLEQRGGASMNSIIRTKHSRRAGPIVSMVMLLLGLPFFLARSPGNVLTDAAKCVTATGLCYVLNIVAQSVRSEMASALPAWLPILIFGTIAVVLIDRIKT